MDASPAARRPPIADDDHPGRHASGGNEGGSRQRSRIDDGAAVPAFRPAPEMPILLQPPPRPPFTSQQARERAEEAAAAERAATREDSDAYSWKVEKVLRSTDHLEMLGIDPDSDTVPVTLELVTNELANLKEIILPYRCWIDQYNRAEAPST